MIKQLLRNIPLFAVLAVTPMFGAAIGFSDAPISHDSRLSLGFEFTTNEAITVTALGYFDENGDGFLRAHEVGIFNADGNLLTSVVLAAGTDATLQDNFRYSAITPFTLPANSLFILAATTGGFDDGWAYGSAGSTIADFVVDPRISVASNSSRFVYQGDDQLRFPTDKFGHTIYAGPNFLLAPADTNPVPEPTSVTLAVSGLAGLLWFSRRRARA